MATAAEWRALEVKIPGKDILGDVRDVLETLVVFLEIGKAILNTIKTFLTAIGNPIKALVLLILSFINSVIESLKRSGFYMWYNLPNLREDPDLKRHAGGYPAFVERWKGSLLDAQDVNRPRPIAGFNTGGFVLIVADVQGPAKLIRLLKVLKKFFSSDFTDPQYPPPANVRIVPASLKGKPYPRVSQWYSERDNIKALSIQWRVASSTASADPSFSGLAAEMGQEFVPPKWLIERTTIYPVDEVADFSKPGVLTKIVDTEARNPRTDEVIQEKINVVDEYGQSVVLMEEAYVIEASRETADYIIGLLGTFRFTDKDVDPDKQYWYRIRAFSGALDWRGIQGFWGKITFKPGDVQKDPNKDNVWFLSYPSTDPNNSVVMGQASPIIPGRLPVLTDFDVVENLRHIFLAAFSLNFHAPLQLTQKVVYDATAGKYVPVVDETGYPVYDPLFDSNGDPLTPMGTNIMIGQGSLSALAGALASYAANPSATLTTPNGSTSGATQTAPWVQMTVRLMAARLTVTYAGLILEAGKEMVEAFKELMTKPLPFGSPLDPELRRGKSTIRNATTLSELVMSLAYTEEQPTVQDVGIVEATKQSFVWETTTEHALTYGSAFADRNVRKNILAAVSFIKSLGYQGTSPDWTRVSLLQDVLPWSNQLIYRVLNYIQGLVDAFNDLLDDIVQFINLVVRKIDSLERFLQFLIMILNYIEQLSAGFYFLYASGLSGGVPDWFRAIDQSTGNKPKSTIDGGYTGGVCLAYLAPDVSGIETALKQIF